MAEQASQQRVLSLILTGFPFHCRQKNRQHQNETKVIIIEYRLMIIINRNKQDCSFHYESELPSGHYLTIGYIITVKFLSVKEDLTDIHLFR